MTSATKRRRGLSAVLIALILSAAPLRAADIERTGGPYVPTPLAVVEQMLRMANVRESDYVIDLGSGDGVIVLTAARLYKAGGMGVDIDPDLVKLSNDKAIKMGVAERVRFAQQDVFKTDLSKATVLTLYLLPAMMLNLRTKIFSELKPGVRVVSHDYHFGDWRPDDGVTFDVPEKESITGVPAATVNLWVIPARVAGTWEVQVAGGETYELALKQRFQTLEGMASSAAGKAIKPQYLTLRGNEFSFALPDARGIARFSGRVQGSVIEGTVELPGGRGAQPWTAVRTAAAKVITE